MKTIKAPSIAWGILSLLSADIACSSNTESTDESSSAIVAGSPITSGLGGKCLDDEGDGTTDGNKIQIYDCNGTSAQSWLYTGGTLVGPGGKCLDIHWDDQAPGTVVDLYDCNGTSAQQWILDGTAIKSSEGLCLDVQGAVNANGTQVQVYTCNGTDAQVWHVAGQSGKPDAGSDSGSDSGGEPVALCPSNGSFPAGRFPTYSACFTGNTPLHHRVASLVGAGWTVQSDTLATNYWAQGQYGITSMSVSNGKTVVPGGINVYPVNRVGSYVSGTLVTGNGDTQGNASGMVQYLPVGHEDQPGVSDHHAISFDFLHSPGEIDDEGDGTNTVPATPTWPDVWAAGYYPFENGTGICPGGQGCWSGTAGGMAYGATAVSYQEIADFVAKGTHIGHAFQLLSGCIGDYQPGVYPDVGKSADTACATEPTPVYGALIHLKSSVSVPSLTSNPYCQAVLYAMQDYGGYTGDTSGNSTGIFPYFEGPDAYNIDPLAAIGPNPWAQTIPALGTYRNLATYFDGNDLCFSFIKSASDIEVLYPPNDSPTLPPQVPYGTDG